MGEIREGITISYYVDTQKIHVNVEVYDVTHFTMKPIL